MTSNTLQHSLHQAAAHSRAGRLRQAAECYRRVLQALPLHPLANARLGALLQQQGQAEAALGHLRRAAQAQPRVLPHWVRLLAALQALGNVAEAHAVLARAAEFGLPEAELQRLSQALGTPPHARQLGLVQLHQKGQHLTTQIAAHMFIDDYPDHPLGWQVLGAVLHDSGQLQEALAVKQDTVQRFPQDANAHNNLAHTLLALQRPAEALASARTALQLAPQLHAAQDHQQRALAALAALTAKPALAA